MAFKIGDKVKLRRETIGQWGGGGLNAVARKRLSGVVEDVYGVELPPYQRSYLVKFPAPRKDAVELKGEIPGARLQNS